MRPFLIAALMLLVAPISASAWSDSVPVGSSAVVWTSPQTFGTHDLLRLHLFVGGHELRSSEETDCTAHYYGRGLAVSVNSCAAHLRIRAANVGSRKVLRIRYYRL